MSLAQPVPILCPCCLHPDPKSTPSDLEFWECEKCHANGISLSVLIQALSISFRSKLENALSKCKSNPEADEVCLGCTNRLRPCSLPSGSFSCLWCQRCRFFVFRPGDYQKMVLEEGVAKTAVLAPEPLQMAAGLQRERKGERHRGLRYALIIPSLVLLVLYLKHGEVVLDWVKIGLGLALSVLSLDLVGY